MRMIANQEFAMMAIQAMTAITRSGDDP